MHLFQNSSVWHVLPWWLVALVDTGTIEPESPACTTRVCPAIIFLQERFKSKARTTQDNCHFQKINHEQRHPFWMGKKPVSPFLEVQVGMGHSHLLSSATLQLCFKNPKAKWEKEVSGKRAHKSRKCRGKFHKEIKVDVYVCSIKSSVNLFSCSYSPLSSFKQ